MKILPFLEPNYFDACVVDPPYGVGWVCNFSKTYTRRVKGRKVTRNKSNVWGAMANDGKGRPFVWFLYGAARALKESGCLVCFCRWDCAEAFRLAIGWAGMTVINHIVWDKVNHGLGYLKGSPAPRHEEAWFAVKGGYKFPGRPPPSLYRVNRPQKAELHPTEKPVSLMAALIRDYVPEGGEVLDPCMGAGGCGVACVEAGRKFTGIEIEDGCYQTAKSRIVSSWRRRQIFAPAAEALRETQP